MSRFLYALVPPFALFGPLFIALSIPGLPLWQQVFAYVGAFMSGLAVVAVMLRQREIDARLNALDGGKPDETEKAPESARMRGAV